MAKKRIRKSKPTDRRTSNVQRFTRAPKEREKLNGGVFTYSEPISVTKLAESLNITVTEIIKFLFMDGKMVNINSTLDDDLIALVCLNFGYDFKKEKVVDESNFEEIDIIDDPKDLVERPPVVTIMGHVDHGKTTLLDAIRKTKVAEGEVGGITQAVGAYQVEIKGKKITFLDTPGHAAFTAMRARGSQITDVVIIVVAADDGVMPQTREAVDHAKAADVPIIVAVNKMDKEGADPEKIKYALSDLGLVPEEWGGSTIYCPVSAKQKTGISELLENILVVSEVRELKANPKRYAMGTVVEAELDKGKGPVATVLVQNGSLRTGDCVVVGPYFGRIRQMRDDVNRLIKVAGPSSPVVISGLSDVPEAGDKFMAFKDEKQARAIASTRISRKTEKERRGSTAHSLDDLYNQIKEGETITINVIIKADVQGSAEAVKGALEKIDVEGVKINVIRYQAGAITESDVILADASQALIYGFNVRPDANIRKLAEEKNVDIRLHRVIYALIEEMEAAMKGMLKPVYKEMVSGQLEIRQLFKVSKVGTIAGCYVTSGFMKADSKVRLIRDGIVIYDGVLGSLKRFQNDVKEIKEGYECGCTIKGYDDLKEGDIIEGYYDQEVARD
ncbi:translation initiation factor IF-2 [bacterium]|jgi:translation initiation factor IF-2|nr:translation initiation factor IF-2 [bacterium]